MTELRKEARSAGVYMRVVKIRWHVEPLREQILSVCKTRSKTHSSRVCKR